MALNNLNDLGSGHLVHRLWASNLFKDRFSQRGWSFFFFVIEEYNYMRALTTAEGIIDRESDVKKWPEIALTRTMQSRFLSPAG